MSIRPLRAVVAVAALALPASASAATRVVDQQAGPYATISDALSAADPGDSIDIHPGTYDETAFVNKDDITLRGPGATIVNEGIQPVLLSGARSVVDGLAVVGGSEGVVVLGDGAQIRNSTIAAQGAAVRVNGAVTTRLDHVLLRSHSLFATGLDLGNAAAGDQRTIVSTSVIIGGPQGSGISVYSGDGFGISTTPVGQSRVDLVHVTIAGAATPIASRKVGEGHDALVTSVNTLIRPGPGADVLAASDPPDFHLREDAVAAGLLAGSGPVPPGADLPHPVTDYDGVPLGPSPNAGAFQFVDHAPTARLAVARQTVRQGQAVRFDASASADPDPGGRIATYDWSFGDGTTAQTSVPTVDHAFAPAGRPAVTVTTRDLLAATTVSAPLTLTVTDKVAPVVRIASPRAGSTRRALRRSGKRRVVNVVKLTGRVTDASGVARVEVTLRRGKRTYASRATVSKDGTLAWHSPITARLNRGRWTLTVVATDRAGNVGRRVLHFTVT